MPPRSEDALVSVSILLGGKAADHRNCIDDIYASAENQVDGRPYSGLIPAKVFFGWFKDLRAFVKLAGGYL